MHPVGHPGRALDEGGGPPTAQVHESAGGGDQRGHVDPVGLGHGRVRQHQGLDVELAGGAHGDRTAPVVGGEHQRTLHLLAAEGDQLLHPLGEATGSTPLRPPHPRLVDGDHPPLRGQGVEQVAPHVAPGRVPVDADHGAGRPRAGVEDVPVDRAAVGAVDGDPTGPGRVEPPGRELLRRGGDGAGGHGHGRGCRHRGPGGRRERRHGAYQISSAAAQLSPDPMPISSTRSPVVISSATVDRV